MKQLFTSKTIIYSKTDVSNTINLIFAIFLLIDSFITCRILSNIYFSNHFFIKIVFNFQTISQFEKTIRQHRKIDAKILIKCMKQKFLTLLFYDHNNTFEINEYVNQLLTAITRNIEKFISLARICKYFKSDFDEKCKKITTTTRRLHKVFQKKNRKKFERTTK